MLGCVGAGGVHVEELPGRYSERHLVVGLAVLLAHPAGEDHRAVRPEGYLDKIHTESLPPGSPLDTPRVRAL